MSGSFEQNQYQIQDEDDDIQIISTQNSYQMPLQIDHTKRDRKGSKDHMQASTPQAFIQLGIQNQQRQTSLGNTNSSSQHQNFLNIPLSSIVIQPNSIGQSGQSTQREISKVSSQERDSNQRSAREGDRSSHAPSLSQGSNGSSQGHGSSSNSHNGSTSQIMLNPIASSYQGHAMSNINSVGSQQIQNTRNLQETSLMAGGSQHQGSVSSSGGSENIQVFLRMRPLNQRELNEDQVLNAWKIQDSSIYLDQNPQGSANGVRPLSLIAPTYSALTAGGQSRAYTFNKCFDDQTPNNQVYEEACRDLMRSSLEGINGTIFMYGQTGAGKTFTMLGDRYQSEIREQASQLIKANGVGAPNSGSFHGGERSQGKALSQRGSKTPLKGSFASGQSNLHQTSVQTFNSNFPGYSTNIGEAITERQQVSPISNQKTAGIGITGSGAVSQQHATPVRGKQAVQQVMGAGNATHRSTLSQIGRLNTETPRHIKNSASGKNQSGTRIPLPLYKQQSVFNGSTNPIGSTQIQKTRNNMTTFNKSISMGGQQLFHTGSSSQFLDQLCSSYGENNMNNHQNQLLGSEPTPQDYVLQTQEDYDNTLQESKGSANIVLNQEQVTLSSARQLNFGGPKGEETEGSSELETVRRGGQSRSTEGILISSLKELFAIIKSESSQQVLAPYRSVKHMDPSLQKYDNAVSPIDGEVQETNGQQPLSLMPKKVYIIRCSYFEIYNDAVYDLLSDHTEASFHEPLQLLEDIKKKEFIVKGLREHVVQSLDDCLALLRLGEVNRHYAETKMNHQSSRSHTLFRLHVESMGCDYLSAMGASAGESSNVITESVLNFVDLAGSEKVSIHQHKESTTSSHSQTRGKDSSQMRVREGQHINRSLFFLTQVIALKAEGKKNEQHIPYRNSPLTKLLRSSLGGNSRTAIMLCITPAHNQLEQTLSTLRFGQNAKMIKNQVVANVVKKSAMSEDEAEELKAILGEYERRLGEMHKDNQDNHNKLQQVIETLMREKDELNQRLLKANNKKLQTILTPQEEREALTRDSKARGSSQSLPTSGAPGAPGAQPQLQPEDLSQVKSFYLFDCGVVNSFYSLEAYLPQTAQERYERYFATQLRNGWRATELLQVEHVLELRSDKLDSNNSKLLLNTLKAQKKETRELRTQLEAAEETNEELRGQAEAYERHLQEQDQAVREAAEEIQRLREQNQKRENDCQEGRDKLHQMEQIMHQMREEFQDKMEEMVRSREKIAQEMEKRDQQREEEKQALEKLVQELQQALQKSESAKQNREIEVERLRETVKMQAQQLDKEVNEKESLIEKYQSLMQNRYQVDQHRMVQEQFERLQEVEMQLFKGIQLINQEKGRRIFAHKDTHNFLTNSNNNHNSSSLVQHFQLDSDSAMVDLTTTQLHQQHALPNAHTSFEDNTIIQHPLPASLPLTSSQLAQNNPSRGHSQQASAQFGQRRQSNGGVPGAINNAEDFYHLQYNSQLKSSQERQTHSTSQNHVNEQALHPEILERQDAQEELEESCHDDQEQEFAEQEQDSVFFEGQPMVLVQDDLAKQKSLHLRDLGDQEENSMRIGDSSIRRLDFDIVDMSKVQRDTSSYLQSNIIPSDQYTIDDQNILNRQSDLQTFQNLVEDSQDKEERERMMANMIGFMGASQNSHHSRLQDYSDAQVINDGRRVSESEDDRPNIKSSSQFRADLSPEIPKFKPTYSQNAHLKIFQSESDNDQAKAQAQAQRRNSKQSDREFIESHNDLSQILRNQPRTKKVAENESKRQSSSAHQSQSSMNSQQSSTNFNTQIRTQKPQEAKDFLSQQPIDMRQPQQVGMLPQQQLHNTLSAQSFGIEEVQEDTFDERSRLQERANIMQRQIQNIKCDKQSQKENAAESSQAPSGQKTRTPQSKYINANAKKGVNPTSTAKKSAAKTPNHGEQQSASKQLFNFDNDFSDSLRFMANPQGSISTKANQQQVLGEIYSGHQHMFVNYSSESNTQSLILSQTKNTQFSNSKDQSSSQHHLQTQMTQQSYSLMQDEPINYQVFLTQNQPNQMQQLIQLQGDMNHGSSLNTLRVSMNSGNFQSLNQMLMSHQQQYPPLIASQTPQACSGSNMQQFQFNSHSQQSEKHSTSLQSQNQTQAQSSRNHKLSQQPSTVSSHQTQLSQYILENNSSQRIMQQQPYSGRNSGLRQSSQTDHSSSSYSQRSSQQHSNKKSQGNLKHLQQNNTGQSQGVHTYSDNQVNTQGTMASGRSKYLSRADTMTNATIPQQIHSQVLQHHHQSSMPIGLDDTRRQTGDERSVYSGNFSSAMTMVVNQTANTHMHSNINFIPNAAAGGFNQLTMPSEQQQQPSHLYHKQQQLQNLMYSQQQNQQAHPHSLKGVNQQQIQQSHHQRML